MDNNRDNKLKLPPQNLEAEQSLLGALLIDQNSVIKVSDLVQPRDFYKNAHRLICEKIFELYEKREPVDLVTITELLERGGQLEVVGGASYLSSLVNGVPSAAHVVSYANIVRQKAILRSLISVSSRISQMAYDENEDVEIILDRAEQSLFSISRVVGDQNFVVIRDVLINSFERIDQLHKNKGQVRGVPTGIKGLDHLLSGLQRSDLVILAARPSMGKTSLAMNIAQYVAVEKKIPVAIYSLEMSKEQLVDRLICGEAGLDSWKLRTGNLNEADFEKLQLAMGSLSEAPLYIDDTPALNVVEVRAKARRLHAEVGLGLVVVDYLQLLEGRSANVDNRVQVISEISRSLKALARELDLPVMALSQLSRAVESRPDKRPLLSDLRESGSIEQDADVVMFLYREDYYDRDTERKHMADVLVRKHRNGPIGDVELFFVPEYMRFRDVDKQHG
ncbi:MAG: replicative DNA helicase [Patescibacteria group bacterium]